MPAMGEAVRNILEARAADIKSDIADRITAAAATPEGQKLVADWQAVADAVDVLVDDVRAAIEAHDAQAAPPPPA